MTTSEVTRPRPTAPPVYRDGPSKMSEVDARSWNIDDVLDAVFFAIAAVATLWLAWLLIGSGWHLDPVLVLNSLLFWAVLAYLALPRLHQVLTWLYVPDYFIGRTRTPDGLLGDPVNLAVKGDEEDIHEAMVAAGWVRADPITLRSSWRIVVSSLLRRSYPAAPVSSLMLFGRKQSFAYQKEVEGNPAQRHVMLSRNSACFERFHELRPLLSSRKLRIAIIILAAGLTAYAMLSSLGGLLV